MKSEMKHEQFFDKYGHLYGIKNSKIDYCLIDFMKKNLNRNLKNLLDIGGGTGTFAKLVISECPNISATVIDPSKKLLDEIKDNNIKKSVGKLPNDIYNLDSIFAYVHIRDVLHHVTGPTIKETKNNISISLQNIKIFMNDDGYLLIQEIFYESYIIKSLTSRLIYYLCNIQNKYHIKIPINQFLLGLEVYFYTREELTKILKDCDYEIIEQHQLEWKNSIKKRLLFLKNWGRIILICKKKH